MNRYELVFRSAGSAEPGEDTVVVSRTAQTGPGGSPVYADESGILRAEISDQGEVRILATGGHQDTTSPVRARPLD
ncbi:DUF6296 family protein [Streptomyces sp. NPDC098789]|uniref:DUF6296 family protein n=1 Tax=Streptomyces sp. NPDC098789 TaxID=3366098 RepID=UPI0038109779